MRKFILLHCGLVFCLVAVLSLEFAPEKKIWGACESATVATGLFALMLLREYHRVFFPRRPKK